MSFQLEVTGKFKNDQCSIPLTTGQRDFFKH